MNVTLIWFIAGLLLLVAEIVTPGFVLACFGVGCFVATIPALFDLGIVWQVLAFAVGSLLSLFCFALCCNASLEVKPLHLRVLMR